MYAIRSYYGFDCSKLDQWGIVFSHMGKLGLMLQMATDLGVMGDMAKGKTEYDAAAASKAAAVITSYSIHYTKLYDVERTPQDILAAQIDAWDQLIPELEADMAATGRRNNFV